MPKRRSGSKAKPSDELDDAGVLRYAIRMSPGMTSATYTKAKPEVFAAMLRDGKVLVHLDPRPANVEVPPAYKGRASVALAFGSELPIPTTDLKYDDELVEATLIFQGTACYVRVPWQTVFGIATLNIAGRAGEGIVWDEDVPTEVREEIAKGMAQEAKIQERAKLKASFRVLKGGVE